MPASVPARGTPPAAAAPAPAAPAPRPAGITPDSIAKLRQIAADQVMASIAGRENEPAEVVFKNIQLFKGRTAGQLVALMNNGYGRALSMRCTSCHLPNDYASDSLRNKQRARVMQTMVNAINAEYMPKINATRPPTANCMTCHHGLMSPNQSLDVSLPQPPPAARGGRGGGR